MSPELSELLRNIFTLIGGVGGFLVVFHFFKDRENKRLSNEKLRLEIKILKGENVSEEKTEKPKTTSVRKYYAALATVIILIMWVVVSEIILLFDPNPLTRFAAFFISLNVVYFFVFVAVATRLVREIYDNKEYEKVLKSDLEHFDEFIKEGKGKPEIES